MEQASVEYLRRKFRPKPRGGAPKITFNCAECGAERTRWVSQVLNRSKGRISKKLYCSKTCQSLGTRKYRTPADRKKAEYAYQRRKYQTDAMWRERRRAESRAYLRRIRNDPVKGAALRRRATESTRRRLARLRRDPVAWAAHMARQRAYHRKYREKKRKLST